MVDNGRRMLSGTGDNNKEDNDNKDNDNKDNDNEDNFNKNNFNKDMMVGLSQKKGVVRNWSATAVTPRESFRPPSVS